MEATNELNWSITESADSADAVSIHEALRDYVAGQVGPSERKDLTIALKGVSGELVGGLRGFSHWKWFYISHLWVSEAGRSSGLGAKLIEKAEMDAKRRGLVGMYVDTFDARASGFYKRCGFSLMGEIQNFPPGQKRFYLTKALG